MGRGMPAGLLLFLLCMDSIWMPLVLDPIKRGGGHSFIVPPVCDKIILSLNKANVS